MNMNQTPLCARYYSSQVKIQQQTRQRNHCFAITALIELPNWEERPFPARKAPWWVAHVSITLLGWIAFLILNSFSWMTICGNLAIKVVIAITSWVHPRYWAVYDNNLINPPSNSELTKKMNSREDFLWRSQIWNIYLAPKPCFYYYYYYYFGCSGALVLCTDLL